MWMLRTKPGLFEIASSTLLSAELPLWDLILYFQNHEKEEKGLLFNNPALAMAAQLASRLLSVGFSICAFLVLTNFLLGISEWRSLSAFF